MLGFVSSPDTLAHPLHDTAVVAAWSDGAVSELLLCHYYIKLMSHTSYADVYLHYSFICRISGKMNDCFTCIKVNLYAFLYIGV